MRSKMEEAIRAAGANADAARAGKGAVAMFLAETDNPQEYAATISIVVRDWCAQARRDAAPRAEIQALRAAACFARQVHLLLERCAKDRPLDTYIAVNRTRRGFCRPIPGLLPGGRARRTLKPYRVADTCARWDKRMGYAPYTETIPVPWWARRAA